MVVHILANKSCIPANFPRIKSCISTSDSYLYVSILMLTLSTKVLENILSEKKVLVTYFIYTGKLRPLNTFLRGTISWLAGLTRKLSWLISMFYPGITENNQDKP